MLKREKKLLRSLEDDLENLYMSRKCLSDVINRKETKKAEVLCPFKEGDVIQETEDGSLHSSFSKACVRLVLPPHVATDLFRVLVSPFNNDGEVSERRFELSKTELIADDGEHLATVVGTINLD